ncbi:MAG: hypothetical protein ACOYOU_21365, partial [Kiritimatiellia bacterium]
MTHAVRASAIVKRFRCPLSSTDVHFFSVDDSGRRYQVDDFRRACASPVIALTYNLNWRKRLDSHLTRC